MNATSVRLILVLLYQSHYKTLEVSIVHVYTLRWYARAYSDFYISLLLLFFTFSFFFVTKTDEKYDDIFCKSVSAPIANLYLTQFKIAACRYIIWYYFPQFFFLMMPHLTRFNMEAHFLFVILLMQLNASNDMDIFFCQHSFWKNVHSSMQIFYIF